MKFEIEVEPGKEKKAVEAILRVAGPNVKYIEKRGGGVYVQGEVGEQERKTLEKLALELLESDIRGYRVFPPFTA
jgi:hypothetical protein